MVTDHRKVGSLQFSHYWWGQQSARQATFISPRPSWQQTTRDVGDLLSEKLQVLEMLFWHAHPDSQIGWHNLGCVKETS